MKRLFLAFVFFLSLASVSLAAPIAASTELAIATDVEATVSRVDAASGAWTKQASRALEFGGLKLKTGKKPDGTEWSLFLPDYYYVIDIGPKKGTFPAHGSIQINYNEGANPNAPGHGLGYKATVTYCKTYFASRNDWKNKKTTDAILGKVLIKDGFSLPISAVEDGWLRLYVGIVTNDPNANPADPSGAEVFSGADKAGNYSGGLVITLI